MMSKQYSELREPVRIAEIKDLNDRQPTGALVENADLVIVRYDNDVSVLFGRCLHQVRYYDDPGPGRSRGPKRLL